MRDLPHPAALCISGPGFSVNASFPLFIGEWRWLPKLLDAGATDPARLNWTPYGKLTSALIYLRAILDAGPLCGAQVWKYPSVELLCCLESGLLRGLEVFHRPI